MVIKLYISNVSGSMDVKKHQDLIRQVLEGHGIQYEEIDVSDPALTEQRNFMWENGKPKQNKAKPIPPQVFNDNQYCGDFDDFNLANESNSLNDFLKIGAPANVANGGAAAARVDNSDDEGIEDNDYCDHEKPSSYDQDVDEGLADDMCND